MADSTETPLDPSTTDPDKRPLCAACKDPVTVVFVNGQATFANYCRECWAELRWGKIPPPNRKRTF